ncbi:MAG: hypothetical protein GC136_10215 [Alphaproteobacteria bacterium]|nr:hypothetical protein [Alphaproteobacteria bacterium]
MTSLKQYSWLLAWSAFIATLVAALPLLPVDETRYLTVAWEMRQNGEFLLMTLNGEPYSHKPPLLFWLINIFWSVFGVNEYAPRIMNGLITAFFIYCVSILERTIYKNQTLLSPWLLLACPLIAVYGDLIMFDCLLACFVALGITAIYKAADTGKFFHYFFLFGLTAGMGVLAKGPVVLVHTLPVILLAPLWSTQARARKAAWYLAMLAGLVVATIVALGWAIPAALQGGKDFAHELFVTQSAGRMGNSFDHYEPLWWYIPLVPVFVLPLLFTKNFWQALRTIQWKESSITRFLLCWLAPTFLIFTLMGGKQAHYLIPLLPALLLLVLPELQKAKSMFGAYLFYLIFGALITLLPFALQMLPEKSRTLESFAALSSAIGFFFLSFTVFGYFMLKENKISSLAFIALLNLALFGMLYAEVSRTYLRFYDLRPFSAELQKYKNETLGYARNYQGEFGFLARMEKPFETMDISAYPAWLDKNKNGIMVLRVKDEEPAHIRQNPKLEILFEHPYRTDETFVIVKRK